MNIWQFLDTHPWSAFGAFIVILTLVENIHIRLGK